jgi:hypothetical protein
VVAFDAVGPSATAAKVSSATTLTWNHTVGASGTYLLVGATCDQAVDAGFSMTAKYNTVAMTPLGSAVHAGATNQGFLQVWGMASPPTGSALAVLITAAGGTPTDLNGGSLSFSAAGPVSATQSATGNSGVQSLSFSPTVSGNVVAAFCGCGSALTPSGSFTSRFNGGTAGGAGCGWVAGSTLASTGSAMTPSWTSSSDFWAVIAVEVQAAGANPNAGLPSGTGAASGVTTIPYRLVSNLKYATAASDLGGGTGAWGTPQYAEGGP